MDEETYSTIIRAVMDEHTDTTALEKISLICTRQIEIIEQP